MPKVNNEQKHFYHGENLSLENFAKSLFGKKYHGSVDWTAMRDWKQFYIAYFEVLERSVFQSIGSVDTPHKNKILGVISDTISKLRKARLKDHIHCILIVALLKLVFLLLGRSPYHARGRYRSLATFRTLTYSQTEEQLSWLLQGDIQGNAEAHGFADSFEADSAYQSWARENKKLLNNRSAYVEWVRIYHPETYGKFL